MGKFQPGHKFGKGRPKGSPNKKTVELNLLTRMQPFIDGQEYQQNITGRILRGKAPHMETYLAQRLHGKAREEFHVDGEVVLKWQSS